MAKGSTSTLLVFLGFGVETERAQFGMHGLVKVNCSIERVLQQWSSSARDKMESRKLFPVPFQPKEVAAFVFAHEPWSPKALVCVYHALVHEFGRGEVDRIISSY